MLHGPAPAKTRKKNTKQYSTSSDVIAARAHTRELHPGKVGMAGCRRRGDGPKGRSEDVCAGQGRGRSAINNLVGHRCGTLNLKDPAPAGSLLAESRHFDSCLPSWPRRRVANSCAALKCAR